MLSLITDRNSEESKKTDIQTRFRSAGIISGTFFHLLIKILRRQEKKRRQTRKVNRIFHKRLPYFCLQGKISRKKALPICMLWQHRKLCRQYIFLYLCRSCRLWPPSEGVPKDLPSRAWHILWDSRALA